MQSSKQVCRNGKNCYYLYHKGCAHGHTEEQLEAAAKQRREYNAKTQPCLTMCSDPTCNYAGPGELEIMKHNLEKIGQKHMIPQREADFHRLTADKAHVGEMIKKDNEQAIVAALYGLDHFNKMIAAAELAEQSIQDQFDAFVAENEIHQERANALTKEAPGAPVKPPAEEKIAETRELMAKMFGIQLNFDE